MPQPLILIPALLCDDDLYTDVIAATGDAVDAMVMLSPLPDLVASAADILARAPARFVLAGTSYGGALALEIAIAAPERVSALWIMGCGGDAIDPDQGAGMVHMIETNFTGLLDIFAGAMVHGDAAAMRDRVAAMPARVGAAAGAAEARAMLTRRPVWDRIAGLTMPCLVMWGANDALVPVAEGRKLAEAMPHAHFYAIPGCGHLPTLEKPAEAAAIALDFLRHAHHHH